MGSVRRNPSHRSIPLLGRLTSAGHRWGVGGDLPTAVWPAVQISRHLLARGCRRRGAAGLDRRTQSGGTALAGGIARRVGGRRRAKQRLMPTVMLFDRWHDAWYPCYRSRAVAFGNYSSRHRLNATTANRQDAKSPRLLVNSSEVRGIGSAVYCFATWRLGGSTDPLHIDPGSA